MTENWADDDARTRDEMIAAIPATRALGEMVDKVVQDALADGLADGRRKYSCLHAVDEANTGNPGGMLPIGWRRQTDRTAFLCVKHPDRLLCDRPGTPGVSRSCLESHVLGGGHEDELPARCFTCAKPIPEDDVIPVFAVISLRQPLTVYHGPDREFRYMGSLQTLPVAYLCPRHRDQVDLPCEVKWPSWMEVSR